MLQFLVIGRLQNRYGDELFLFLFLIFLNMYTRLLEPDQITYTQSMVAKRGLKNRANIYTPICEKLFKTQHGRILIDPAILAPIGHRFIAKSKSKH